MRSVVLRRGIVINLFIFTILLSSAAILGGQITQKVQGQSQGEGDSNDTDLQITSSDVRGTYEDDAATVSVSFPEGWSGIEVSQEAGSILVAAVSPASIVALEDLSEADPVMSLVMEKKRAVDMSPGTVPPLLEEINDEVMWECAVLSSKIILLNSVFTEELSSNCSHTSTDEGGNTSGSDVPSEEPRILKSILTQRSDTWIALLLFGTAESVDANEAQFRSAIGSLKVIGARDVPVPFEQVTFSTFNVIANGSIIPVDIKSTSAVAEFALDESSMTASFSAEGVSRQGIVELTLGRILEGPYVVTVNDRVWNDFDVINGDTPRESKIQIRYQEQENRILITGTQVVPEFSLGSLLGSAGGFSTIVFTGAVLAALIVLVRFGSHLGVGSSTSDET